MSALGAVPNGVRRRGDGWGGRCFAGRQNDQNVNRFWHLVGEVIGEDLPAMGYAERLATLLAHRISLWVVIAQACREGSLDSRIRDHTTNDVAVLVATLPNLAAVAFNGGTAARIGMPALEEGRLSLELVRLPSSSPAYAAMRYADKLRAWEVLRRWLTAKGA